MKKYIVTRENVYVGKLIEPQDLTVKQVHKKYQKLSQEEKLRIKNLWLNICCQEEIRPILFKIDDKNQAEDLIYHVDNSYPILEAKEILSEEGNYIVKNTTSISEVLKYLNFPELLTKKDIKRIYKLLIESSAWIKANRKLFGYIEFSDDTYIEGEKYEISPEIYEVLLKLSLLHNKKPKKEENNKVKKLHKYYNRSYI